MSVKSISEALGISEERAMETYDILCGIMDKKPKSVSELVVMISEVKDVTVVEAAWMAFKAGERVGISGGTT